LLDPIHLGRTSWQWKLWKMLVVDKIQRKGRQKVARERYSCQGLALPTPRRELFSLTNLFFSYYEST
jgi:hypothetical protein